MYQVKLNEAKTQLPDLLDAAVRGEMVFITGEHQEVVRLVPVSAPPQRRKPGSARGMIKMSSDFDAPLEDFREYME